MMLEFDIDMRSAVALQKLINMGEALFYIASEFLAYLYTGAFYIVVELICSIPNYLLKERTTVAPTTVPTMAPATKSENQCVDMETPSPIKSA